MQFIKQLCAEQLNPGSRSRPPLHHLVTRAGRRTSPWLQPPLRRTARLLDQVAKRPPDFSRPWLGTALLPTQIAERLRDSNHPRSHCLVICAGSRITSLIWRIWIHQHRPISPLHSSASTSSSALSSHPTSLHGLCRISRLAPVTWHVTCTPRC
jgi:hypothetical protein